MRENFIKNGPMVSDPNRATNAKKLVCTYCEREVTLENPICCGEVGHYEEELEELTTSTASAIMDRG